MRGTSPIFEDRRYPRERCWLHRLVRTRTGHGDHRSATARGRRTSPRRRSKPRIHLIARTVTKIEVLTVGRVSVDLYAEQAGVDFIDVQSFRKLIGGTATNVAVAAAQLGRRAAVLTKMGVDSFGRYVRHALTTTFGVDTSLVGTVPGARIPLAFASRPDSDAPMLDLYRERAPDLQIHPSDISEELVQSVLVLWIPATRLTQEPSRSTSKEILALAEAAPPHHPRPRLAAKPMGTPLPCSYINRANSRGGHHHRRQPTRHHFGFPLAQAAPGPFLRTAASATTVLALGGGTRFVQDKLLGEWRSESLWSGREKM